ncbi:MAG: hypothetical protein Q7R81_08000 [Candidatus Peregrinibacteria bacterium]|nr:hypothetical protein [Candidatus Peregrinibacteria bacterium]
MLRVCHLRAADCKNRATVTTLTGGTIHESCYSFLPTPSGFT